MEGKEPLQRGGRGGEPAQVGEMYPTRGGEERNSIIPCKGRNISSVKREISFTILSRGIF